MLPTMLLVLISLPASLSMTRLVDNQGNDGKDESMNMPYTGAYLTYCFRKKLQHQVQALQCLNLLSKPICYLCEKWKPCFKSGTPEGTPVSAMLGYQTKPSGKLATS